MTETAAALLIATLVIAAADWWTVATGLRAIEVVLKPLTMVVLIAAAIALEPVVPSARSWFLAGLVLSLAGDVFLLLDKKYFLGGLGSFLLGHIAYVIGLAQFGITPLMLLPGLAVVLLNARLIGASLVRGAGRTSRKLPIPVALYIAVISAMVVTAFGSANPLAIGGALLFYVSDSVLGWHRFVKPLRHGRIFYMVAYHLAQIGLVLALVA